jgi:Polyketide cyclase / dehydrase and lipid transport
VHQARQDRVLGAPDQIFWRWQTILGAQAKLIGTHRQISNLADNYPTCRNGLLRNERNSCTASQIAHNREAHQMPYHLTAWSLAAGAVLAMLATATFSSPARAERPLLFHSDNIKLKASPQEAWDAIKTFDQIHKWHPATENTVMLVGANGVPGAVREFQLKGGGFVISELLEYRDDVKCTDTEF